MPNFFFKEVMPKLSYPKPGNACLDDFVGGNKLNEKKMEIRNINTAFRSTYVTLTVQVEHHSYSLE